MINELVRAKGIERDMRASTRTEPIIEMISDELLVISCIVADTLLLAHTLCGVLGILRTRHVRGLSPVAVSGCQTVAVVVRNGLLSETAAGVRQ